MSDEFDLKEEEQAASSSTLLTQKQAVERGWYVIHTYSGYEDQVSENLKHRIESMGMDDKIFSVIVPKEKQIEIKNGHRKIVERRIFPGYVLVEMFVTDDSWYVVRNTPNVTGFIGAGVIPTPLSAEEAESLLKRTATDEPKYKFDIVVGDNVKITDGPFKDFDGRVSEVDEKRGRIKVLVTMFGRETPVELDFLQVTKL